MNQELFNAFPEDFYREEFPLVLGTFMVANLISKGHCQIENDAMFFPRVSNPVHGQQFDFGKRVMFLYMGGDGETTPMPDWLTFEKAGQFIGWFHREQ